MNGTHSSLADTGSAPRITLHTKIAWCLLVFTCIFFVPGCGGCFKAETAAQKKAREKKEAEEKKRKEREKEKKKPKKDFEYSRMQTLPGDTELKRNMVKQGHYITCRQVIVANNFDFQAQVTSAALDTSLRPIPVTNTPYAIEYTRNLGLTKEQPKGVETLYFIPHNTSNSNKLISLKSDMRSRRGGAGIPGVQEATTRMPAHQYFFVVLAQDNGAYTYLKRIDSVAPPVNEYAPNEQKIIYYRVINPLIDRTAPLPSHPFAWTTISYVLWDNIDPNLLSPAQKDAMLDWLHWGGQLVVSGPNSLDTLRGSFLGDYLPVTAGDTVELTHADFAALNANFSTTFRRKRETITTAITIAEDKPMVGSEFKLNEGASFIKKTGDMIAERRVGNGRIVVTRFPLAEKRVINWKSFDNVLNNVILRRPARRFKGSTEMGDFVVPEFELADFTGKSVRTDPRLSSTLRYFSRDIGHLARSRSTPRITEASLQPDKSQYKTSNRDDWRGAGYVPTAISGVGGWNDSSGAAVASRELLVDAAGIKIPNSTFVLKVLMGYLVVLVPVNWVIFRVIRRVEWAWVAAPVIALAGAGAVIKLAELDIGFARSRSEVGTLEVQGGYSRGHLTRYTALYTSLATTYSVVFSDPNTIAQPFATRREQFDQRSIIPIRFHRGRQAELSGFKIKGNDTRNLHTEQMHDLGGTFDLVGDEDTGYQLKNGSDLVLSDAGVLRRAPNGTLQICWLGELKPQTSRSLSFEKSGAPWFKQWDENEVTYSHDKEVDLFMRTNDKNNDSAIERDELPEGHELQESFELYDGALEASGESLDRQLSREEVMEWCRQKRSGVVSLGKLFDVATEKLRLMPGQMRLIGWTDQDPGGMQVRPVAPQKDIRLMVLVHLQHTSFAPVKSDVNSKFQFMDEELEEGTATFGAYVEDVTPELIPIYNLQRSDGVVIVDVTDGGAAQLARLSVGDIILTVDGRAVKTAVEFRAIVRKLPKDKPVEIVYFRKDKKEAVDVVLQEFSMFP